MKPGQVRIWNNQECKITQGKSGNSFDAILYWTKAGDIMIDAEGYDGKIVIDFLLHSSLRPLIIFEYIHIDNKIFKKLLDVLISKKFHYFKINENLICFPIEFDNQEKIF